MSGSCNVNFKRQILLSILYTYVYRVEFATLHFVHLYFCHISVKRPILITRIYLYSFNLSGAIKDFKYSFNRVFDNIGPHDLRCILAYCFSFS